jgi:hypothetical protein
MTGVDDGFLQRHPKMLFHKHAKLVEAGTPRRAWSRASRPDARATGERMSHLRQATNDPTTPLDDGDSGQKSDDRGAELLTSSPGLHRQSSKIRVRAITTGRRTSATDDQREAHAVMTTKKLRELAAELNSPLSDDDLTLLLSQAGHKNHSLIEYAEFSSIWELSDGEASHIVKHRPLAEVT